MLRKSQRDTVLLLLQLLLWQFSSTKTVWCLPLHVVNKRLGEPFQTRFTATLQQRYVRSSGGRSISSVWTIKDTIVSTLQDVTNRNKNRKSLLLFASNNDDIPSSASSIWLNRKNFFVAAAAVLLSSSFLLELYSRIGALFINDDTPEDKFLPPLSSSNIQHATVVFHGSGGQDSYTDALMKRLRKENPSDYNQIVEWSKYSTNIFQASYNGQRIGEIVAKELIELFSQGYNLQTIHLIGISVGSFAADATTREIKKILDGKLSSSSINRPFVQLTLLDPFTQRGIFGVGYGNRIFGKSADYTQQYLNTDDPVPSTNAPLQNSVCYDITNLRPEEIFGHDWPVAYYGKSKECGKVTVQKEEQKSAGTIISL